MKIKTVYAKPKQDSFIELEGTVIELLKGNEYRLVTNGIDIFLFPLEEHMGVRFGTLWRYKQDKVFGTYHVETNKKIMKEYFIGGDKLYDELLEIDSMEGE